MWTLDSLAQGGYTMVAILVASLLAATEVIYCFLVLRRRRVLPVRLLHVVAGRGEFQDPDRAAAVCRAHASPFAHVLLTALQTRDAAPEEARDLVEGAYRRAGHTLGRSVQILELVAAIAPLLGLLGTVIGMYDAFGDIASTGVRDIGELPLGIRKALITTITGLMVAIPSYVFYAYFTRRVEDLLIEMERHTARLVARLRGAPAGERAP